MKPKVVMFYEHIAREYDFAVLLKLYLQRNNIKCEIRQIDSFPKFRDLFIKPRLVLTPYFYSSESEIILKYRFITRTVVYNLRYEQIYSDFIEESNFQYRSESQLNVFQLVWGNYSKSKLLDNGFRPDRLLKFGHPSMDFCRNDFSDFYYSKQEIVNKFNLSSGKKNILFISSFVLTKERKKEIMNQFLTLEVSNLSDFSTLIDIVQKSRDYILDWLKRLLEEFQDFNLIYRPHPSEIIDDNLKHLSSNFKNFKIIEDLSVKQWIKISDFTLNWNSTSSADVTFLDSQELILRPIPLREFENHLHKEMNKITSYDELAKSVFYKDFNESNLEINKFYYNDDVPVFLKLGNRIIDSLQANNNQEITNLSYELRDFIFLSKQLIAKLINVFSKITGIKFSSLISNKKELFFSIENSFSKRELVKSKKNKYIEDKLNLILDKVLNK